MRFQATTLIMNLHILNGESSMAIFEQSNVNEDSLVWHEILCEGPIISDIFSSEFFPMRYDFLRKTFGVNKQEFEKKVGKIWEQLRGLSSYDAIYLWFELDLFCFVNFIALTHALSNLPHQSTKLFWVKPHSESNSNPIGLGEISASEYPKLLEKAEEISSENVHLLSEIWLAYSSDDPRHLLDYINNTEIQYPFIKDLLMAHCRRFPSRDQGIDVLRLEILRHISNNNFESERELIGHLLRSQGIYGFGDLQYEVLIKELSPFIEMDGTLKLNTIGFSLLNGHIDYQEFSKESELLGGADSRRYRWWEHEQKFIPQYYESTAYKASD